MRKRPGEDHNSKPKKRDRRAPLRQQEGKRPIWDFDSPKGSPADIRTKKNSDTPSQKRPLNSLLYSWPLENKKEEVKISDVGPG